MCQSINSKPYRAAISSPLQLHQGPINHPLIHMICPAMVMNTFRLTMWLRWHPDEAIAQRAYRPPARLYSNLPPEGPKNWGQIDPNIKDVHSNPLEISSTFWIPDITYGGQQQQETNSKYADLSNVARDIFSIIPHAVRVEASCSLGRDVFGWRQLTTTRETLAKKVVVRQFAQANNWTLAGTDPELDTTMTENNSEMKKEADERKLHTMAKVHDFLEMWQGSQNLCATL